MAYDIWGAPLKPGHCEVHPWVPEPWPCSECLREAEAEAEYEECAQELYAQEEEAALDGQAPTQAGAAQGQEEVPNRG